MCVGAVPSEVRAVGGSSRELGTCPGDEWRGGDGAWGMVFYIQVAFNYFAHYFQ